MSLILSGTDGLSDVDGSAATPAIRGTDANTGIFFPAADTIAFSEGGAEIARFDSSGNFGIGTSSPAKRLSVVNATDATTVGTNSVMTVQAGSSVNSVAEIGFSYGSWSGTNPIASLGYQITSNAGVGAGALTFSTRSVTTDTAPSERMRIDSSGNVGIGTTYIPSASGVCKIVVGSPGTSSYSTYANPASATNAAFINAVNNSSDNYTTMLDIGGLTGNTDAANGGSAIRFLTQPRVTPFAAIERARIDTSGNLLVGTTTTAYGTISGRFISASPTSGSAGLFYTGFSGDVSTSALNVGKFDNNSTTSQIFIKFGINSAGLGSGQINANGSSAAAFGSFSDSRLKENIVDLPSQLDNIMALRTVEFDYIESEGGGHQIGFIAQEVQEIYPDLVGERADGMLTLTDLNKNDARLIKAIQELKALVDAQASTITALQADVEALKAPQGTP